MRTQVGFGVVGQTGSTSIDVTATSAAIAAAVERSNAAKAAAIPRKMDAKETTTTTETSTITEGEVPSASNMSGGNSSVHVRGGGDGVERGVKDVASALRMQQQLSRANRRRWQDVNQQSWTSAAAGAKTTANATKKMSGDIVVDVDDVVILEERREDDDNDGENKCTNRDVVGLDDKRGMAKVATTMPVSKPSPKKTMQTSSPLIALGTTGQQAPSSPSARGMKSSSSSSPAKGPLQATSPRTGGRSPSSTMAHRRILQQRSAIFKTGEMPTPSVVRSVLANKKTASTVAADDVVSAPDGGNHGNDKRYSSVLRLSGSHRLGPDNVIEVEKDKPTWETRRMGIVATAVNASTGSVGMETQSSALASTAGGAKAVVAAPGHEGGNRVSPPVGFGGEDNDRRGGISARSGENYLAAIARAKKLDGKRSVIASSAGRASPFGRAHEKVEDVPSSVDDGIVGKLVAPPPGDGDVIEGEDGVEGETTRVDEARSRSDFAATRMAWAAKLDKQKKKVSSVRRAMSTATAVGDNNANMSRKVGGDDVIPSSRVGGSIVTKICVSTDPNDNIPSKLPPQSPLYEKYERNRHLNGASKKPNSSEVYDDDVNFDSALPEDVKPLTPTCIIKDDTGDNSNTKDIHHKENQTEPTPNESIQPIIDMDRPDLDPSDEFFAPSKRKFTRFEPQWAEGPKSVVDNGENINEVEPIVSDEEEMSAFTSSAFNPDSFFNIEGTVFDNKKPTSECCDSNELMQERENDRNREDALTNMDQDIDVEDGNAKKLTSEWGDECSEFTGDSKFNDWCGEAADDLKGALPPENMDISDDGAGTMLKTLRAGLNVEQQILLNDIVAEYEATILSRTAEVESMKGEMTMQHIQIESLLSKQQTKENDSDQIIECLNKEISDLRLMLEVSDAALQDGGKGRVGKSKNRSFMSLLRIGTKSTKNRE